MNISQMFKVLAQVSIASSLLFTPSVTAYDATVPLIHQTTCANTISIPAASWDFPNLKCEAYDGCYQDSPLGNFGDATCSVAGLKQALNQANA